MLWNHDEFLNEKLTLRAIFKTYKKQIALQILLKILKGTKNATKTKICKQTKRECH